MTRKLGFCILVLLIATPVVSWEIYRELPTFFWLVNGSGAGLREGSKWIGSAEPVWGDNYHNWDGVAMSGMVGGCVVTTWGVARRRLNWKKGLRYAIGQALLRKVAFEMAWRVVDDNSIQGAVNWKRNRNYWNMAGLDNTVFMKDDFVTSGAFIRTSELVMIGAASWLLWGVHLERYLWKGFVWIGDQL